MCFFDNNNLYDTGVTGIHDDFPVPVVRNGRDQAVDVLVVQQILVSARGRHGLARRCADDLVRQRVAIFPEVTSRDALDAGSRTQASRTPEPRMPMPIMPKRTRSLGATGCIAAPAGWARRK